MKITEYTKKDGSTVYRSSVYLGIDTVTGKKVKTTISGRTKRELKAKALQAQIDFEKDGSTVYKAVEIKTYAELVENWLETYCHTVKKATLTIIKSRLNNYLLPAFGNYRLDKLTPPIIQHQVNQWAKEYNQLGKGYQEYPQLNSLNKRILKYAVSLQAIPFNPARDVIVPR
ncbi:N-terminal phage integrase SAM-like domain-containing protein, partial [Streptococcus pneumoniae]